MCLASLSNNSSIDCSFSFPWSRENIQTSSRSLFPGSCWRLEFFLSQCVWRKCSLKLQEIFPWLFTVMSGAQGTNALFSFLLDLPCSPAGRFMPHSTPAEWAKVIPSLFSSCASPIGQFSFSNRSVGEKETNWPLKRDPECGFLSPAGRLWVYFQRCASVSYL